MKDIEFTSHGVTCRAWLCPPQSDAMRNERGSPALVMAHGTSGVREQLKHYIPRFTEAGMHVILFDYRHFGTSDGEPRQPLSIRRQLQDYAAALDVVKHYPIGHFDIYLGEWFDRSVADQVTFLQQAFAATR